MKPAQPDIILTDLYCSILLFVHSYTGCTIDHIRKRFFSGNHSPRASYAHVARLVEAGLLTTRRLPPWNGIGSGKAFVTLGLKGRRIVAEILEIPLAELPRNARRVSAFLLRHHLALCRFRLAVELATIQSNALRLVDWTSEVELRRQPIRAKDAHSGEELAIVPDAGFTLGLGHSSEQRFDVEIDLDTVSPKRWRAKLSAYLRHRAQLDHVVPVLIVVPTSERQAAIARWATEEARALQADPTIVWLTAQDLVDGQSVLSSDIWEVVGGPNPVSIMSLALDGHVETPSADLLTPNGVMVS